MIEMEYLGGLSETVVDAFEAAARRWATVLTGELPPVEVGSRRIDGIRITAQGVAIDGPGQVLGQAGPRWLRPGSMLPAVAHMEFDTHDLRRLEAEGRSSPPQEDSLVSVITHEMGHCLGLGTLWDVFDLVDDADGPDPRYIGMDGVREYSLMTESSQCELVGVPLEDRGGAGTRGVHLREHRFQDELMTGFLDTGQNPLSRLTIAMLADLGYEVDYAAADAYVLPEIEGAKAPGPRRTCSCASHFAQSRHLPPQLLPATSLIN